MVDRVTFDFETGEILFDTNFQKDSEFALDLAEKRQAIMAAAGYDILLDEEERYIKSFAY